MMQWALNVLKKPIVNMSWLNQCWTEHRLVPQEPYRVLPFSGLTICVTRIPAGRQDLVLYHKMSDASFVKELCRFLMKNV